MSQLTAKVMELELARAKVARLQSELAIDLGLTAKLNREAYNPPQKPPRKSKLQPAVPQERRRRVKITAAKERRVMELTNDGKTIKEIAAIIGCSESTVSAIRTRIKKKTT